MEDRKTIILVIPNDYKNVGGLRIPIEKYSQLIEEEYNTVKILMGYHIYSIRKYLSLRKEFLSVLKANMDTSILVFSGINQAYSTLRIIGKKACIQYKLSVFLADSPYLAIVSHTELCKKDIVGFKEKIGIIIREILYKHKEKKILSTYKTVLYVSPVDKEFVERTYKIKHAFIANISHATNLLPRNNDAKRIMDGEFKIGFLEKVNAYTYIESIKPLLESIMPKIIEHSNKVKLVLVGKIYTEKLKNIISKYAYIEHIDFVENLKDFYDSVDIIINPIRKRNGLLNRVLEAWAHEKCTVGYDFNFKAFIGAQENIHYLCGTSESIIADKIIDCIDGKINHMKIGYDAYELIRDRYNWDIQENIFLDNFLKENDDEKKHLF